MKTQKNILIAFILNLSFSIIEYLGGLFTGSVAILSDSIHDLGDALSIGISFVLERKSNKSPDEKYTYGYKRFSVLGGVITVTILLAGSLTVIINAVKRLINPVEINYSGMIILSLFGCVLNLLAALFTKDGASINQKAVNLHMLEDVLGWIMVLAGAVIMRFTDISVIDPLMSIAVSTFILFHSINELKEITDLFLEKIPGDISVDEIKDSVMSVDGILSVHHIHIRSIDGFDKYVTMHIVTDDEPKQIKRLVKEKLCSMGIDHTTVELEASDEECCDTFCRSNEHAHEEKHHHH